jgi:hypothetical protein
MILEEIARIDQLLRFKNFFIIVFEHFRLSPN